MSMHPEIYGDSSYIDWRINHWPICIHSPRKLTIHLEYTAISAVMNVFDFVHILGNLFFITFEFSFWWWTKRNFIWIIIKRETVTAIIFTVTAVTAFQKIVSVKKNAQIMGEHISVCTLRGNLFSNYIQIERNMILVTVFFLIMNQMEVHFGSE